MNRLMKQVGIKIKAVSYIGQSTQLEEFLIPKSIKSFKRESNLSGFKASEKDMFKSFMVGYVHYFI